MKGFVVRRLIERAGGWRHSWCAGDVVRSVIEGVPVFRVNVVTGELCLFITEVFLPGLIPVDFSRSYQSTATRESCFGPGWSHPYELSLGQEGHELVLRKAGKPLHRFSDADEGKGPYRLVPGRNSRNSWWRVTETATSTSYLFSRSKAEMPVSAIEDIHGNRLAFHYDAENRLVEILDPFKRRCAVSYDGPLLTGIVLVSHDDQAVGTMLLRCDYDREGRLTKTVDANGSSRHFEYDGVRLVSYTNPLGGRYCAQFDEAGRCIQHWTEGGPFTRTFAYDSRDRRTRVLDGAGYAWVFRFDEMGLVTEQTDPMGGVVRFAYDSAGGLIAADDPAGNSVFAFGTDSGGGTTVETVSPGITHIIKAGEAGDSVAIIDTSGQRWEIEENKAGNVTRYKSPSGHIWGMEYDRRGTLVRRIDPDGAETSCRVSDDGRQEKYSDALGPLVTTETDSLGRPVHYTRGGATLAISYGRHQRTLTNDDGSTQVLEQNAVGLPVRYRDEIGAEWRYAWSPHGLLLSIADPLGHQVGFSYDREGRPVSLINERGERFENKLDALGRIIGQREFNGAVSRFEYNLAGDLVGVTSADGAHVSLDRNRGGELHVPSGIARKRVVDPSGRLVSADEPEGLLELDYDPEGRLARESFAGAEVLYEYGWHSLPLSVKHGNR